MFEFGNENYVDHLDLSRNTSNMMQEPKILVRLGLGYILPGSVPPISNWISIDILITK